MSNEEWEEEQKRLDRQWYSMDEGYDESHNPFSGLSDEYTKRKEQELEQKRKKKISARQRQIHKVCCYRATANAYAWSAIDVCLSVHLSVKCVDCDKTR